MIAEEFPAVSPAALPPMLRELADQIEGRILTDRMHRVIYASDSSSYREFPMGIVMPAGVEDLRKIVRHAMKHRLALIPRGAGTSLAGQVVGNGLVVDLRAFDRILALDVEARTVRVEPGVIRDRLNDWLALHGLMFGPETSTANRAVIGGMIGNNSCGMHSLVLGTTRDNLVSCKAILADGSEVVFEALSPDAFHAKRVLPTLEGRIYDRLYRRLSDPDVRREIESGFPKPEIRRRNNGYAVDLLLRSNVFTPGGPDFNMCSLVAGSEGTLCLLVEATLGLVPLLPPVVGLVTMHFDCMADATRATLVSLRHKPTACELIGDFHIQQALANNKVNPNNIVGQCSRWIQGKPHTVIVVEFAGATRDEVEARASAMVQEVRGLGLGYAWPLWFGNDAEKIWTLRRALGGINNSKPGDVKPFDLIEDCAIDVADLPEYVERLEAMLKRSGVSFTQSAHAGAGELHTIVFLDPKTVEGKRLYRSTLASVADLVKSFRGSLSGEHGDGRMRAEFLPKMIGEANYRLCCEVKDLFDEAAIFNPGKIVRAPPMDAALRYSPDWPTPEPRTYFDWSRDLGVVRAVERCNGVAECKKVGNGLMCPSYMATREEKDSTRARANVLREFLTHSKKPNPFDHQEIHDVMDLCLACKGCKSECPASVDMAKLKAEFLQQWHDAHPVPLRTRLIANYASLMGLLTPVAPLFNFFARNPVTSVVVKAALGFAPARSMPQLCRVTFDDWYKGQGDAVRGRSGRRVHLFCDEFTNVNDAHVGICAVKLLVGLGYDVLLVRPAASGRAAISQGFLKKVKELAEINVKSLCGVVDDDAPLVGIEPSAIACFKDEYPDLVSPSLKGAAKALAGRSLMFEEFIAAEMERGRIGSDAFTDEARTVRVHVHCHQKALSSIDPVVRTLGLPRNYTVTAIPSGCCGMAGAFGYEKHHYDLSMKVAEQVLLPAVRAAGPDDIVAASGTSCRHQIADGTGRRARHTAEILWEALKGSSASA
ncbi:FAD-linked oxidase C-terminal domain-containing protein [Xanthobacteraceae bacterium Astr-EGSB]|uniref:FAD-binding and (Fe-S)-binding domain-containing protein n=1 Tax=Astrobacterium formosum TaxID=3069710 RepID=UPI0027B4A2A3|nr:FAD-linked oxidase C-terminal domain-containing protein [Xanthobacteraceae bacterium Astr-EGSB]